MKFIKNLKSNNQGTIVLLAVVILFGAITAATFSLQTALRYTKSSLTDVDAFSAVSSCKEMANGYSVMNCDTIGSCVDSAGDCVTCGSTNATNNIGDYCSCEIEVVSAGPPITFKSKASCLKGKFFIYDSAEINYTTAGGASPVGL